MFIRNLYVQIERPEAIFLFSLLVSDSLALLLREWNDFSVDLTRLMRFERFVHCHRFGVHDGEVKVIKFQPARKALIYARKKHFPPITKRAAMSGGCSWGWLGLLGFEKVSSSFQHFPSNILVLKNLHLVVTSQIPPNKGAHFTLFNVQLNALIFYKSVTCDWKRCLSPQQICWFLFVFGREKLKWSETCKTLTRNSTYGA